MLGWATTIWSWSQSGPACFSVRFDASSGARGGRKIMMGGNGARRAGRRAPCLFAKASLIALVGFVAVIRVAAAQGTLIMYCGVDENWCRAMTTQYQKETGVDVKMTRMS